MLPPAAQGVGPSLLQPKSEGLSFSISQMYSFSVVVNLSCFLVFVCYGFYLCYMVFRSPE